MLLRPRPATAARDSWRARWLVAALLVATVATPVLSSAAEPDVLAGQPGFVDLDTLGLFERAELNVHISVKGPLLTLVADAARESDPELSKALAALQGVEVRVYEVGEKRRGTIRQLLESTAEGLTGRGWSTAITVRVDRDHGYALLRFPAANAKSKDPLGLVAMYLTESNEAVFVNIVGRIDTATIGRLARRFDLDLLAVEPDK